MPANICDTVRGHRERLRERFSRHGLNGFHDYEIVELLLTYAVPRVDVKPLAKRLLKKFGTLAGVFDATIQERAQVAGIGGKAAAFLSLIRNIATRYLESNLQGRSVFDQPDRVKAHLRSLLQGRGMECFGAIFTDQQHRHLATEIMFEGTVDRTAVYPRNIMKRALILDAKGLILFHNHPGGTRCASQEDIDLTRIMVNAGGSLNIMVLDHFLIAGKDVLSFKEKGWF